MLLSRLSVKSRFLLVLVVGFVFQACISLVSLVSLKHNLSQARTIGDIDACFRTQALSTLWVCGALTALAGVITCAIGDDLARALNRLSERVARFARGEFAGEIPGIGRRDELGVMARALLGLRDSNRDAAELRLDQLTGLPDRKLLMDRIRQNLGASARSGNHGGVLLIDLDKFKIFNESKGHDNGDLLLKQVASRLSACTRKGDTVARLGGDEFVVVVANVGQDAAEAAVAMEAVAEKILATLRQPCQLGQLTHTATASIGLTLFKGYADSIDDLLKHADMAMYKAKHNGGDTCQFFDPDMQRRMEERAALEADLRQAIAENQFELYYQPQVGAGGQVKGAEALIRWNHPQRGLVMPGAFIPLAEETGLILALGRWVLESACGQLAAWATRPETAGLRISVNVSAFQFQQPDFVEQVIEIIQRTGAEARNLGLELTESLLVKNIHEVIEKMAALKRQGVEFSLDDFGTGYSSLSYLRHLPLDELKIDRGFVNELLTNSNDAAIVLTIIALAKALGLSVIAEGVETMEQRDFLATSGCLEYQGYFYSRPLPLARFEGFALSVTTT